MKIAEAVRLARQDARNGWTAFVVREGAGWRNYAYAHSTFRQLPPAVSGRERYEVYAGETITAAVTRIQADAGQAILDATAQEGTDANAH